jgi:hypothetical protein
MRALLCGECLYNAIRRGKNFLFLLKNRGMEIGAPRGEF